MVIRHINLRIPTTFNGSFILNYVTILLLSPFANTMQNIIYTFIDFHKADKTQIIKYKIGNNKYKDKNIGLIIVINYNQGSEL